MFFSLATPFYLSFWDVHSLHNASSVKCANLRYCSQLKETTGKKINFSPYFWSRVSHTSHGCIKTKQPFSCHSGVHLVLTVNWKGAVLQLPHRLITNCFPGAICSPNVSSTERYCYELLRCLSVAAPSTYSLPGQLLSWWARSFTWRELCHQLQRVAGLSP